MASNESSNWLFTLNFLVKNSPSCRDDGLDFEAEKGLRLYGSLFPSNVVTIGLFGSKPRMWEWIAL